MRSANFNAVVGAIGGRGDRARRADPGAPDVKANPEPSTRCSPTLTSPDSASGTPEQIVERLTRHADLGCEYAILYFPEAAYDRSGIELFEREVIPALS